MEVLLVHPENYYCEASHQPAKQNPKFAIEAIIALKPMATAVPIPIVPLCGKAPPVHRRQIY